MNTYAQIDSEGNVVTFPYHDAINLLPNQDLPEDAVVVDTQSQKPTGLKWYQACWHDRVEREGENYVVYYTTGEKKWANPEEKKKTLNTLIRMDKMDIQKLQDEDAKTANLAVLDTIDVDDETTYDNYHNLTI